MSPEGKRLKIVIGIATRSNDIYYKLLEFVVEQFKLYDCELVFGVCGYSAEHAQRKLFGQLREKEFDYLLLVDTDVAPPLDVLERLIDADKDIVAAPVWHYDPDTQDVHLNVHYERDEKGELVRVREEKYGASEEIISTSFACLLVKKAVFAKLEELGEEPASWSPLAGEPLRNANTDNIFYAKVRALGFKLFVCWAAKGSVHHRIVDLDGRIR